MASFMQNQHNATLGAGGYYGQPFQYKPTTYAAHGQMQAQPYGGGGYGGGSYNSGMGDMMDAYARMYGIQYGNDTNYRIANEGNQWQYVTQQMLDQGLTGRTGMTNTSNEAIQRMKGETELGLGQLGLEGTQYRSDAERQAAMHASNQTLAGQQAMADASRYASQTGLQGTQYSSDATLRGQMYGADASRDIAGIGANAQLGVAGINAQAQMLPAYLQHQRFNSIAPQVLGMMGGGGGSAPQYYHSFDGNRYYDENGQVIGSSGGGGGMPQMPPGMGGDGASTGAMQSGMGPLFTQQQQAQMMNRAVGANEAAFGGQMQGINNGMAGRGFSAQSPAAMGAGQRADLNRMLANTEARVNIPMQAQQANAQYGLQANQQANAQRLAQQQLQLQGYLGQQGLNQGRQNSLLQLLMGAM